MNDRDERVERVLAGLREAEVPAGMEERVLLAVRAREAAAVRERGWWPAGLRGGGVWAGGLGAAAVLAVMVAAIVQHQPEHRWKVADMKGGSGLGNTTNAHEGEASARLAAPRITRVGRRHVPRAGWHGGGPEVKALVSFPAPPLPLTEQERLLLRVVHGRDPVEMAMLDGVSWRAQFAESRAEFQRFFEVTPTMAAAPATKVTATDTGEEK